MNKQFFSITALVLCAVVAMGCSEKDPSFSLLEDSDTFQQGVDSSVRSKIDVLWMIDNSGSMESSQQNVIDNLSSFINDFQTKNLDFKMAVLTTDAYKTQYNSNTNCARFRNRILNSNCNTVSNTAVSVSRILDPTTPNLAANFMINARQTDSNYRNSMNQLSPIYGSGDERAFQSLKVGLELSGNAGFLRSDSFLAVIIVSDEDDFSHNSSTAVEVINNYAYENNPWSYPNLHSVQSYVDFLDSFTSSTGTTRRYNVSTIGIWDQPCLVSLNSSFGGRKIGVRHGQLSDLTQGTKTSLCGNFSNDLKLIADNILTLTTQFYLNRVPIESSIVVKVNGVTIPKRATNPLGNGGWEYDAVTNSIKFFGSNYIPEAGAKINVKYDPLEYGS